MCLSVVVKCNIKYVTTIMLNSIANNSTMLIQVLLGLKNKHLVKVFY